MTFETREKVLVILDQMGKFSFIDTFIICFMVVSFYVIIQEKFNDYGLWVEIIVQPVTGVNTFAVGTLLCCFYSHLLLYFDEKYAKKHY